MALGDYIDSNKYMDPSAIYNTSVSMYGGGHYVQTSVGMAYKGSVDSVADLPTNPSSGDVYNVKHDTLHDDGCDYVWTGTAWDCLGDDEPSDVEVAIPITYDDLLNHAFHISDGTITKLTWDDVNPTTSTKKVIALPRMKHNGITWNEAARYVFL